MSAPPEAIGSYLDELADAWPERLAASLSLLALREVDSTQRLARTLLERHFAEQEQPHPFAVVAGEQSAGRGRRGRTWQSAAGLGVWASLALPVLEQGLQSLPMRIAVALAECANRALGAELCRLKWPNDLVIGRRKLGGLLVDALSRPDGEGWAIAGFGLNHGHGDAELPAEEATSLRSAGEGGPLPPLARFAIACLVAAWDELRGAETGWLERYRALAAHREGDPIGCELAGERVVGRFVAFDAHGFLVLETDSGRRTVRSGEVFAW